MKNSKLMRKYFAVPKEPAPEEGFFITTPAEDLEHDRIFSNGADLSGYLRNPIVLWLHDAYGMTASAGIPVGTAKGLEIIPGQGIRATGIDWLEGDPFADRVKNAWDQRKIRGASVGFVPTKVERNELGGHDFLEWKLLEFSLVPVPANPEAVRGGLALAVKALGGEIDENLLPKPSRQREKVVPHNVSEELADKGTAWAAPTLGDFTEKSWGDLSDAEKRAIAGHYAWAKAVPPETFGDLKLPHHRPNDGKVVWNGVKAAMGALLGARGGVDIPAGDRRAVYGHLKAHYEAFGETAPDFQAYDPSGAVKQAGGLDAGDQAYNLLLDTLVALGPLVQAARDEGDDQNVSFIVYAQERLAEAINYDASMEMAASMNVYKEGRVLSQRNYDKLKGAHEAIGEVLGSAEAQGAAVPDRAKAAGTEVQTVICSKDRFDSEAAARKWVMDHDFKADKVDETSTSYRFRQFPPGDCQAGAMDNGQTFATIELDKGVQAVICKKQGGRAAPDPAAVKQAILSSFESVK